MGTSCSALTQAQMVQPTTHVPYMYDTAYCSRACYCAKCEIKSSPGENDAVKRRSKYKMCEAAAGITQHVVIANFFSGSRKSTL